MQATVSDMTEWTQEFLHFFILLYDYVFQATLKPSLKHRVKAGIRLVYGSTKLTSVTNNIHYTELKKNGNSNADKTFHTKSVKLNWNLTVAPICQTSGKNIDQIVLQGDAEERQPFLSSRNFNFGWILAQLVRAGILEFEN